MSIEWLIPTAIVVATIVVMEAIAAVIHRYVMHGFGWGWHRSHHEQRDCLFEKNDLYALLFATISIGIFAAGAWLSALWWIGLGMAAYGILYAILHDALVHRRLPVPWVPRRGYLKRLVQAHRLHHAVQERRGAVSFGFLYALPVGRLVEQLQAKRRTH